MIFQFLLKIFTRFFKNMISKNVMGLLLNLAEECHLKKAIQSQFDGLEINETEAEKFFILLSEVLKIVRPIMIKF